MTFIKVLTGKRKTLSPRLKYDKRNMQWTVVKSDSLLYMGSESECRTFLSINKDCL